MSEDLGSRLGFVSNSESSCLIIFIVVTVTAAPRTRLPEQRVRCSLSAFHILTCLNHHNNLTMDILIVSNLNLRKLGGREVK